MPARCFIVPPHLLHAIAESAQNPEHIRLAAQASLKAHEQITGARKARLTALARPRGASHAQPRSIVPPHVLRNLAQSDQVDESGRDSAQRTLQHVDQVQLARQQGSEAFAAKKKTPDTPKDSPRREVHDAAHASNESKLPGKLVRAEGDAESKDKAVNEAYDNVGTVLSFYKDIFEWKSIDNENMDVVSSVHFGDRYENAFWDPERLQMVFGDGDEFLNNFTGCIDVIGHELTHAVTEHTSPLDYWGQAGALNEHISDVFGIMVKQKLQDEKADVADWLIGEDCILPGVKGVALRSMKAPGTAYDDPRFGKDPQPDHMSGYKTTFEDNGGVHIYSGIPNKAFYLASVAFGGYSWEKAGQIWWKAMSSGKVPAKCDFKQFADITVDVAEEEFGEEAAKTVRQAWTDVGVVRGV